jgi:peptide/nickel transport system substrate-binding protein
MKLARRAFLSLTGVASSAHALGRTPLGGQLRLDVPWPIEGLDPHALHDGFSALFAHAAFDCLYAVDNAGRVYPALAQELPRASAGACIVTLRPGLTSARGKKLSAADLAFTWSRALSRGGAAVLSGFEPPRAVTGDALALSVPKADPQQLALALANPLTALVPRGFSALQPDGTGAFAAELTPARATLTRNLAAARGAAFLDRVELTSTRDLTDLLRRFEAGASDVAWFGTGLYKSVSDARKFDAGRYGFAVLSGGKAARAWSAPGTLQALLDGVAPEQLAHLGLRDLPQRSRGAARWGGGPADLNVDAGAPQLVAIGRVLSSVLSAPGHELRLVEHSTRDLERLRATRDFALLVHFVSSPAPTHRAAEAALRAAANPELAKRAPLTAPLPPREVARGLTLGVIGELTLFGAHARALVGLDSLQLGSVWWRPTGA